MGRRKSRFKTKKSSSAKRFLLTIFLTLLVVGGAGAFYLFFENEKPSASFANLGEYIGLNSTLEFTAADQKSGIRNIRVTAVQDGVSKEIFFKEFPRTGYQSPVGPLQEEGQVDINLKKTGFKDGKVRLILTVHDFSFLGMLKGNETTVNKEVTLDTEAPKIQVLHTERYIYPGGSGIAIYKVSDPAARHGVMVNDHFNEGFPVDEKRANTFISFFGVPYNTKQFNELAITATDAAGNTTTFPFSTILKKKRFQHDTINVGSGFLSKKIPEFQQYYPEMQGDYVNKYLFINREVRLDNNIKIQELCSTASSKRLWKGVFGRMAGSLRAGFADHRTYKNNEKEIDRQVHLGVDIASTRRAPVKAANNGIVVYADYLGIYGNMILVDHGQGVFSLYSHLSKIETSPGSEVKKDDVIGLTGTTGMAGGDHLHFSVLINGVFVTPKEWWDKGWIEVTIEEPVLDSRF